MRGDTDGQGCLPSHFSGILYKEFIAHISRLRQTRNYLEIGVNSGQNLSSVSCDTAVAVDPGFVLNVDVTQHKRRTFLYRLTSDRFFAETDLNALLDSKFDLAFLDGLHQFEFLLRDFYNAEAASSVDGLILLHDCLPLSAAMTVRNPADLQDHDYPGMWTGDVWKLIPILRQYRPDLELLIVDCPPTGLVCVTGLDPQSSILRERYLDIVREFHGVGSGPAEIAAMYADNRIVRSADILRGQDHSLYFRI